MATWRRTASLDTIERAQAGQRDAMAQLWRIYQPQLLRFLRAKRAPMAADIASEVWVDVARSIERFQGDGVDLQRWLFTIAHRRSVDEYRRAARRRDAIDDGLSDHWRASHVDDIDAADGLERAISMLRQLPENTAAAVMLRVVYELPVADVADIIGCSHGNVRVLAHRGINRLRELVAEDLDLPAARYRVADASTTDDGFTIAASFPPAS